MKPLAIELFAGKFGWGKGFVAEGWRVIGFDIVHEEWHRPVPPGCELILQHVLTLHGSQFAEAAAIVASPPCQAYSYRAMPWKRAKALPPPSNELFDACFRIQREASEAKGEYIPMVVENVKGAQTWVGRAKWHYGSFYLWGDVPALMPHVKRLAKVPGLNWSGSNNPGYVAKAFNDTAAKNNGGSWFAVAHNTESGHSRNPVNDDAFRQNNGWDDSDGGVDSLLGVVHHPGGMPQAEGFLSGVGAGDSRKGTGGSWFTPTEDGRARQGHWRDGGCVTRTFNSKDVRRKAASAAIAEIPFELASHIARCFYPR